VISTLKVKKSDSRLGNDSKVNLEVKEPRDPISESLAEDKIRPLKTLLKSQQYYTSSNQNQAQNKANFKTLSKIPEEEQIEIVKLGFQLNEEKNISLQDYYEGDKECSLFQSHGYRIKYDTIRRKEFYKRLKPK